MMTLYRLYATDETLLYVGISEQALARWDQHRQDKPWWLAVARVEIAHFPNRATARAAEAEAIKTEGPKYNRTVVRVPRGLVSAIPPNELHDQVVEFLLRKRRKSVATQEQYRFVLERVFLPWCADEHLTTPTQVDDKAMERFTDFLAAKDRLLAVASIRSYVRAVRVFLSFASVPKGQYEALAEPQRMRDTLSRIEVDRMERAAVDERDRLIVRVLADTGIRVSELVGLRPESLREDKNRHKYFVRVVGKGDKEREVGVPEGTFRRLQNFAATVASEYIFCGRRMRGGIIEPLTRNGVDQLVRATAMRANIGRRVWPHLFRHSYVTQMARKEVPMEFVRRSLGHTTLAMVSQVYSHITADDSYDALMAGLK
jgi:integrase/recombinase XerD